MRHAFAGGPRAGQFGPDGPVNPALLTDYRFQYFAHNEAGWHAVWVPSGTPWRQGELLASGLLGLGMAGMPMNSCNCSVRDRDVSWNFNLNPAETSKLINTAHGQVATLTSAEAMAILFNARGVEDACEELISAFASQCKIEMSDEVRARAAKDAEACVAGFLQRVLTARR